MKSQMNRLFYSLLTIAGMLVASAPSHAAEASESANVPVKMTVTSSVASDKRMPEISREDVRIMSGKERLPVTQWIPAQGEHARLDLFLLIDDASDSRLGLQLEDLRTFINNQPATTAVGVGYMSNATVQIVQQFTTDHALAAKALRLPFGSAGAFGSPYLSVVDLMKRWPATESRREVVMVTDGVDRARRSSPANRGLGINPDVDTASAVAQRTGTVIHTIYTPGTGQVLGSHWAMRFGQMNMGMLSDQTGGESYFLGFGHPVSFKPYLEALQRLLDNQYLLSFSATPGKKPALQQVTVSTEVAGVDLLTADAAWVPVPVER